MAVEMEQVPVHQQTPAERDTLPLLLEGYARRVYGARRLRYVAFAVVGVGLAWLLASVALYSELAPAWIWTLPAALTFLLPIAAFVLEKATRPRLPQIAALLDKRLDDRERVVTSVELLAGGERPLPGMSRVQLSTTHAILGSVDPQELYPAPVPWPAFSVGVGLVLVALGLMLLKGLWGDIGSSQAGSLPSDQGGVSSLISPTPQPGLPDSQQQQQQQPGLNTQSGTQGQNSGGKPNQSSTPVDPANADALKAASQAAEDALKRLTQALDQQSVTQQTADSLRKGDYGGASQQLSELGQQNDQLSQAAKQGLGESLQNAARDSASATDLQKAEQAASDALKAGDYAAIANSLQQLGAAIQQTARSVVPQQDLAKSFPDTGQSSLQPGQEATPGAPGAQESQQSSGQTPGQGGQQSQQNSQGQGQGQQSPGGQQGAPSQASGGTEGKTGQGNTATGGDGHNSRVLGPADTQKLDVGNNPFQIEGQPRPGSTQPGDKNQPPGLSLERSAGAGGAQAPSPGGASSASGESNRLPVERWGIVQRYFGGTK